MGHVLKKKNTHLRESINVECRIAVTLSRLATGNSLRMIEDVYGIGLNTTSIIMRECCEAIAIQQQPLVFPKPILTMMKEITSGFEALHDIIFILGPINVSHISILAPSHGLITYYNKKIHVCFKEL